MLTYRFCFIVVCSCITVLSIAQTTFVSATDKNIHYEGRILFANDTAELMWPGTSVTIHFTGTGIDGEFKDEDTSNYYNVIVDGNITGIMHFGKTRQTYTLADGLPAAKHILQLFKRTEWDKGRTWFYGFYLKSNTSLLSPLLLPKRKIEFFGNSITCGYAINDVNGDHSTGYYENNYDAYAAITARHFNAQYHCTAKSGIGVMVSWFPLIMPEMYNRTDPEDSNSRWDFSQYIPDVVVIDLFQNDSWIIASHSNAQYKARFGTKAPTAGDIIAAYKSFVQKIRDAYPNAKIICMLGNMDITRSGSRWPGYVQKAVTQLKDSKIFTWFAPYKNTPGHPKVAEQKALAEGLIKFIQQHIIW